MSKNNEQPSGSLLASPPCSAFDRARLNDPIVHAGMQAGCDYEEIIAKMFERHEAMTARLMELEMIAPRRIRVGDHDMVYHTPDHLIPVQNAEVRDLSLEFSKIMKKTKKLTTRIVMLPISIPIVIVGVLVSPMVIAVDWSTHPNGRYTLDAAAAKYFSKLFSAI